MNDHALRQSLRDTGHTSLNHETADTIRKTLLTEFDDLRQSDRPPVLQPRPTYHIIPQPMIPVALAAILLAIGVSTTAAANAARPGDVLYGWDQAAERVRFALTIGDNNKAAYQARVAEERLREQFELEDKQSVHAIEATANAGVALDQAIQTVGEVRIKLESKPGKGAEALTKVETRLRNLRDRHEAREKKNQAPAGEQDRDSSDNDNNDKRQNDSPSATNKNTKNTDENDQDDEDEDQSLNPERSTQSDD